MGGMMTAGNALVFSAGLAWLMLMAASLARSKAWTPSGMKAAFGNRGETPEVSPAVGRADRAAKNMLESLPLFVAVVGAAHIAGQAGNEMTQQGATLYFWARVAYWGVYVLGIPYLRTVVWFVGVVGMARIGMAALN